MVVLIRAMSALGSGITAFALSVWIYEKTGSYDVFAALAIATAVAGMIFSPVAGWMTDRFRRRNLLIACDVLGTAVICSLLFAVLFDMLTPALVGAIVVALALISTVTWPAIGAAIGDLADEAQRPKVNGLFETLQGANSIAGPLLGAALYSTVGLPTIAVLDILSYMACAFVISRIEFPSPSLQDVKAGQAGRFHRLISECTYGFSWIWKRRALTHLLLFFAITNLGASVFAVAYAPYILSFSPAGTLGICFSMGGLGMVLGGVVFSTTGGIKPHEMGIILGTMAVGACTIAFGIVRTAPLLFGLAFLIGFCFPFINASSQTIWQSQVPSEARGRVFATRKMIAWSLNPLAILVSIPLLDLYVAPLIAGRGGHTLGQQIWGSGQTGALGLLIGMCGALSLGLAVFVFVTDAFRSLSSRKDVSTAIAR